MLKVVAIVAALTLLLMLIVGGIAYASIVRDLPDPGTEPMGRDQTSAILDRNGEVLTKLFAEENRTDRSLADIPLALKQAVIATEDKRFYDHGGVDPWGIARALWVDVTQGKQHGGSTITQQWVKNAFVTPEMTIKRKMQEAVLSYRLEKEYDKDEILELYLNTIYYGHGAYGVEAASQAYFGKPVTDLTLAESAMVAGVIRSPGNYSPYLDPDKAKERRALVLGLMADQGYITGAEAEAAAAEEFALAGLADSDATAPYFVEYIKAQLIEEYGSEVIFRGGVTAKTTLDLRMQHAAEQAIAELLDQEGDPSAALVALDPNTGEILAMVGGRDFNTQQFNVAVQGRRQPGSAFKPFVLATALDEGVLPEKTFPSGSRSFQLQNGQTWKVTGRKSGGAMRLRTATEKSVNSVFAQLILDVGPEDVVATAEKLGMHEGITPVPAIALGGLEEGVSPLEMAGAYGVFAANGKRATPYGIAEVTDAGGEIVRTYSTSVTAEAIDPAVAYLTTDILKGVISRGTGTAANIGRYAAGKTGTTQEYRDAWFVGYTPDLVCAVWVGYPEAQTEMTNVHGRRVTGGSFPAEIWKRFMDVANEEIAKRDFDRPEGLVSISACTITGLKATEWCPTTFTPLFISGHTPQSCNVHTGPETIEVPNLVGMTKEKALALLQELMLLFEVGEDDIDGVPTGIVARQSPASGSIGTTETVVTIIVSNGGSSDLPPIADFTFGPADPRSGTPVVFDASISSDDGEIMKYYWEFDDGQTAEGVLVTHIFEDPGTYEVTLWITDDAEQTSSVTKEVDVN